MCFLSDIFQFITRAVQHAFRVVLEYVRPRHWIQWKPTSMAQLVQVEQRILKCVKSVMDSRFVTVRSTQSRIWSVTLNRQAENTPLVMVHGMGGGLGLWVQNMDALAQNRPVYTFDLLGFGRSSRPTFSSDPKIAEDEFVHSIEEWRQEVKLEKFILLGHSLGAFISSSYAMQHPDRVKHLILVDPWGFPEKPPDNQIQRRVPTWIRMIATMLQPFNPLAGLRVAGPWGPGLVKRFRPDLQTKFADLFADETIFEYIYHCNAQKPSGETAFKTMQMSFGWARNPMINRITDVAPQVSMTFIHGSRSWIDQQIGHHVKKLRSDSYVAVQSIPGAGHHVYADKPVLFNNVVQKVCDSVDTPTRRRKDSERTRSRGISHTLSDNSQSVIDETSLNANL
ncbi:(Lyso)-N-acylphosphatidylethanolamine lipase-like isoform X1 [Haliotis asinina]|uniref:(Lyso)-N-acylphosphatidylethanolamine lipase-like isoform X1 n=2 Tax=Haliotis asinina TaxID=109174 RepID=UPI003531A9C8